MGRRRGPEAWDEADGRGADGGRAMTRSTAALRDGSAGERSREIGWGSG